MNGVTVFVVEDGVCKLPDRSAFAGSICTADRCVREAHFGAGLPIYEAVKMISAIPCRIMGLNKGVLARGYDADIVVFDDNINVRQVYVGGNRRL